MCAHGPHELPEPGPIPFPLVPPRAASGRRRVRRLGVGRKLVLQERKARRDRMSYHGCSAMLRHEGEFVLVRLCTCALIRLRACALACFCACMSAFMGRAHVCLCALAVVHPCACARCACSASLRIEYCRGCRSCVPSLCGGSLLARQGFLRRVHDKLGGVARRHLFGRTVCARAMQRHSGKTVLARLSACRL